jgi:hypothetical protein
VQVNSAPKINPKSRVILRSLISAAAPLIRLTLQSNHSSESGFISFALSGSILRPSNPEGAVTGDTDVTSPPVTKVTEGEQVSRPYEAHRLASRARTCLTLLLCAVTSAASYMLCGLIDGCLKANEH